MTFFVLFSLASLICAGPDAAAGKGEHGVDAGRLVAQAKLKFGEVGGRAAKFLVAGMPEQDRKQLTEGFLLEEIGLALAARAEFPWARQAPEEIFFNDVLPYAVFDEPRDPWRKEFLEKCRPLIKDCKTATEAAQTLNRDVFKLVKVHYNTGRKRPNQSAKESAASGRATCTGLAIILVNACRSVGVPARAAGTELWTNLRGNHTWTEIWDGDWHFTGADEYDANGLDRGWFVGDAAQAKGDVARHAIFATSWKPSGDSFPMVWNPGVKSVAAVNVTSRYARSSPANSNQGRLGVRVVEKGAAGRKERIVVTTELLGQGAKACQCQSTKAGTADWNDLATFEFPVGKLQALRFHRGEETRERNVLLEKPGDAALEVEWAELPKVSAVVLSVEKWLADPREKRGAAPKGDLSKSDAERIARLLVDDERAWLRTDRAAEMEQRSLKVGGKTLQFLEKTFGAEPADGRSLWISMHGGGGAPAAVNDGQWKNQIGLYKPAEGVYIAPRAPNDAWNMWFEDHVDPLFDRLIADCVALRGVNPDKVYLLGYSAGGDGVWQLAPRMADRWAAAAMMAGHPNASSLLPLRNLPFAIFMGAKDAAYNRNKVAGEKAAELDRLQKQDPQGYEHLVRIYPGLGHWMQRKDAEALPWMAKYRRNAWPKRVIWEPAQGGGERFYWLASAATEVAKAGRKVFADVEEQRIRVRADGMNQLQLRLSDSLLDLDQPVVVEVNGKKLYDGPVPRSVAAIRQSLVERFDAAAAASGMLSVHW